MTHAGTLFRLAVLELWTSFRLLAALAALLASGAVAVVTAALIDPMTAQPAGRLAIGAAFAVALALGISLVTAIIAGALAGERRRGFAGWLVSRSAPRATLVVGWFWAGALLVVTGGIVSGVVAWLALASAGTTSAAAAGPFAAAVASALAAGLAAVALGLLAGATLPPIAAGGGAALVSAAALVGMAVLAPSGELPGAGFAALATFHLAPRPVADGLASAGAALAMAAVLLIGALVAFERADL